MSWRNNIMNRINQIKENNIEIINDFPTNDNFSKSKYRKAWVTTLFVDIVGYTNYCNNNNDIKVGMMIKTFQEGVLSIMNQYGLKHIQIQGDGIFGVLPSPKQNDKNNKKMFDCAMDINGYLNYFWGIQKYKISLSLQEELMVIVGTGEEREVVFAGGSVNKAKKIIDTKIKTNCILIDKSFVKKNAKLLWNSEQQKSYISGTLDSDTKYSIWHYSDWEK